MKTLPHKFDSAAEEQASLWAARLEGGTLSAADRDALDAWLNADATHRPLLSRYCQFSADLEEQLLALLATGGVQLPPEPPALAPVVRLRRWNFPRVAFATLAAAAAIALTVFLARPAPRALNFATAAAQRSTATLPDGTRVELNAHTRLAFASTSSERHARLASGEAFFTVAKDQAHPFIVETPAGSVRVTGTVFNVRADPPAELAVTVVEGSVQVRAEGAAASVALTANDQVVTRGATATKLTLSAREIENALAWRRGQIVFDHTPLGDALARVGRYHDAKIIPSSTALARHQTVGGAYNLDDLEKFLADFCAAFELRATHEPNGTIRLQPADER